MLTSKLTQARANELFEYREGKLYWKINKYRAKKGKEAGCIKAKGYKYVSIDGVQHRVHRVIYLMINGNVPPIVDHHDENRLNNDVRNLKEISNSENLLKAPLRKTNSTGYKGITKVGPKFKLRTTAKYGAIGLGSFNTLEGALMEAKAFYGDDFKSIVG